MKDILKYELGSKRWLEIISIYGPDTYNDIIQYINITNSSERSNRMVAQEELISYFYFELQLPHHFVFTGTEVLLYGTFKWLNLILQEVLFYNFTGIMSRCIDGISNLFSNVTHSTLTETLTACIPKSLIDLFLVSAYSESKVFRWLTICKTNL